MANIYVQFLKQMLFLPSFEIEQEKIEKYAKNSW